MEVGQQQLWARGGGGQRQEQQQWDHGGDGQQQHGGWNRQHQPHFPVQWQRNQPHLSCHQQRSTPHQQQRFSPPSQHPHQRGGQKSGPGGPCNCGQNATWYQEESPVPANAPMCTVHKCSRCGRSRHLAIICGVPRRFEGNCAACEEHGHLRRFCVTTRRPIPMQPHANVSLRLAVTVAILREITMTAAAGV